MPKYVNIAFNLPLESSYTYYVPDHLQQAAENGKRALAPLGKRNYTGIIIDTPENPPEGQIKNIIRLLDEHPIINDELMKFCKWISSYYLTPFGEVLFAAVPKGISVENRFVYKLNEENRNENDKLTELQKEIVDSLKGCELSVIQLEKKLKRKGLYSAVKALVKNNILTETEVMENEKVKESYKKFVIFDMLDDFREVSKEMLYNFFSENKIRSEKQLNLLNYLIRTCIKEIALTELVTKSGSSVQAVNALVKKELLRIEVKEVMREPEYEFEDKPEEFELNKEQSFVVEKLISAIKEEKFKPFLLYGITGSGKTQVYIEAVKYLLSINKTAIILVPEISLTPQLIQRFRHNFGDIVGVMHSRLSHGERFDVFRRISRGELKLVIGPRSALFAPFNDLGMIIVDEEHDSSYKQNDMSPRYQARDCAMIRARNNNAVILLGSATPSLESYYNALTGKYELITLNHRAQKTKMPEIEVIGMLGELRSASKFQKYENLDRRFLSLRLIHYMDISLQMGQSTILLQNRRGYSSYFECHDCGNVMMCDNCDITLTYHKGINRLLCHYCGTYYDIPDKCQRCGSANVEYKGTGTEKIEEEIKRIFPQARVKRMDSDTVTRKDSHRRILKSFYDGEFEILVGTQMISKGLDFPRVQLVGVINADIGLFNPDFRASEKTFQLLMQVSGRSGRNTDFGKVVIQTLHPSHPVFKFVKEHDYLSFYEKEILFRSEFIYPPFSRIVSIEVNGLIVKEVYSIASRIYSFLINKNRSPEIDILKPSPALIYKLKNKYRYNILIKTRKFTPGIPDKEDMRLYNIHQWLLLKMKEFIIGIKLKGDQKIIVDVDPIDFN